MLEDRDYMRQPDYLPRTSLTVVLLWSTPSSFWSNVSLPGLSRRGLPVQLFCLECRGLETWLCLAITDVSIHARQFLHILVNSWAIYVFGREIEEPLATKIPGSVSGQRRGGGNFSSHGGAALAGTFRRAGRRRVGGRIRIDGGLRRFVSGTRTGPAVFSSCP